MVVNLERLGRLAWRLGVALHAEKIANAVPAIGNATSA
jgi:hypothetical protein